jgi:DNA-binding response OmpR family regulator
MLPKLDGISLCQQLRQAGHQMLILLLTAKDAGTDKVLGLDAGADDYVIKPFDFQELSARIRALLRRGNSSIPTVLEWGNLYLDTNTGNVGHGDRVLQLTSTEHRLLELFLRNRCRVFSRSAIVDHLWTTEDPPQEATIKSYIKTLRQKLNAAGAPTDFIETVYGLGYRLKP